MYDCVGVENTKRQEAEQVVSGDFNNFVHVLGPVDITQRHLCLEQRLTFVVEQTEISQDEPLPFPKAHPRAVLQRGRGLKSVSNERMNE